MKQVLRLTANFLPPHLSTPLWPVTQVCHSLTSCDLCWAETQGQLEPQDHQGQLGLGALQVLWWRLLLLEERISTVRVHSMIHLSSAKGIQIARVCQQIHPGVALIIQSQFLPHTHLPPGEITIGFKAGTKGFWPLLDLLSCFQPVTQLPRQCLPTLWWWIRSNTQPKSLGPSLQVNPSPVKKCQPSQVQLFPTRCRGLPVNALHI